MIKLIENIFFTTTISNKASLPGSQINPAGIYSSNESMKIAYDGKTDKESIYSSEGDPANTYNGERFEKNVR
jgi:hypothetical protein